MPQLLLDFAKYTAVPWSIIIIFVFDKTMIRLALYLDFKGAKNIHLVYFLSWGFGGGWRFLTGIEYLYLDLDMVTGFWYNHDLNFGSLS